jgi:hypothetical protein
MVKQVVGFPVEFKADSLLLVYMNVEALSERIKEAANLAGFNLSYYGKMDGIGLPVLERKCSDDAPEIYISSGVHGDEPAPPMAVLEMLKLKGFPESANYTIFPLINPTGLQAGTRENRDGIDLNRDYGSSPASKEIRSQVDWLGKRKFALTMCLHEDYDGNGFYVYAHSKDKDGPDYAGLAISAAHPFTGTDTRTEIDEMPAKDGRMFPPMDVMDRNREDLPEALRLLFHHSAHVSITTETPSGHNITSRIAAQCAVPYKVIPVCFCKQAFN